MKRLDLSAELTHQVAGDLTGSLRGSGKYQPTTEIGTKNPFQYIARKSFFFTSSLVLCPFGVCDTTTRVFECASHAMGFDPGDLCARVWSLSSQNP